WSLLLLAVAIQVKLTAGAFLPYFAYRVYKEHRQEVHWIAAGFAVGFMPTLVAGFFFPVVMPIIETLGTLEHNAWYWNWTSSVERGWPYYIRFPNQMVSYSMLAVLIIAFARAFIRQQPQTFVKKQPRVLFTWPSAAGLLQALECTPAIIFLAFAKTSTKFMGWYWMALLPFLLIISNPLLRLMLVVLALGMEVVGYMYLLHMVTPYVGDFYKDNNIEPFGDLGTLFNI
ncbi:MAG: hypothetical protein ACR2PJ_07040, partial [Pseudomonadales bacterium]